MSLSSNIPAALAETSAKTAPLQEIFSSVQGEGIHVGKRQLFVRFAHCHLKCAYCDTPMTSVSGKCHVETEPGSGQVEYLENPVSPELLASWIHHLLPKARHHSISFTGGEPLLYHRFLAQVFPQLQAPIYLETSGTQPDFLETVLPWVNMVAMDIKLPSATQEPAQFEAHRHFLEVLRARPEVEVFIKLVFNQHITPDEIAEVAATVTNRQMPLILQPETSLQDRQVHVSAQRILEVEQAFSAHFSDVRVIPQTHKMLSVQ